MTQLAYVSAASHSGSTLLSMLLGSHRQVATVGEIKLSPNSMGEISRYRCSCGEFIRQNIVANEMKVRCCEMSNSKECYREV